MPRTSTSDRKMLYRRAAQGADLLDKKVPNWFRTINPSRLNITDRKNCIVGQLYPYHNFNDAFSSLKLGNCLRNDDITYGLELFRSDPSSWSKILANAWKKEITKRKGSIKLAA